MINLAGVQEADLHIGQELQKAGIKIISKKSEGEVPYFIEGELNGWKFKRAWCYWSVSSPEGLEKSLAIALHEKPNAGEGGKYSSGDNFGSVIRVQGHCGCPHPEEWLTHYDKEGRILQIDKDGSQKNSGKTLLRHVLKWMKKTNMPLLKIIALL